MKPVPSDSSPKRIAIIGGCGHVGLPLGVAFASQPGHHVTLIDTNLRHVETVNRGSFPFIENGGDEALGRVIGRTLFAETTPEAVRTAHYVVFVTGTPVDEHLNPCIADLVDVLDQYLPLMQDNQLIILRSTVFPGSTELLRKKLHRSGSNIEISFCPERVAQGHALEEIPIIPQIVSAFDEVAENRAANLFAAIAPEIIRLTPKEAELTKLFANSWRYISFAIANQFYIMAEGSGVDFERIYHALTHNYPRAAYAHPGFAAGPCLFKDTLQLSAFYNNNFFLGHAAMLINEGLPRFVVEQLERKLHSLDGKKIGLLGMAFKANHDDTRDSLAYKLKKMLESKLCEVLDTDVYQPTHSRLKKILSEADAFVLGVPHQEYRHLDLGGKPFVDCWGFWNANAEALSLPAQKPMKAA